MDCYEFSFYPVRFSHWTTKQTLHIFFTYPTRITKLQYTSISNLTLDWYAQET